MEASASSEPVLGSMAERVTEIAREALLERCRLRADAVRMQCRPITRGDTVCGLHFAVRGPRDVLLTAVWDADSGTLWCYDSRGERFLRAELPAAG